MHLLLFLTAKSKILTLTVVCDFAWLEWSRNDWLFSSSVLFLLRIVTAERALREGFFIKDAVCRLGVTLRRAAVMTTSYNINDQPLSCRWRRHGDMLRQGGAFVVAQKIHNRRRRFIGVHSTAAAAASCVIYCRIAGVVDTGHDTGTHFYGASA